jgi:hypothetical protein
MGMHLLQLVLNSKINFPVMPLNSIFTGMNETKSANGLLLDYAMELPFRLLMNLTPMKIPAYKAVH